MAKKTRSDSGSSGSDSDSSSGSSSSSGRPAKKSKKVRSPAAGATGSAAVVPAAAQSKSVAVADPETAESSSDEELYVPLKVRRQQQAAKATAARKIHNQRREAEDKEAAETEADAALSLGFTAGPKSGRSLIDQRVEIMSQPGYREKTDQEKLKEEEAALISDVSERKPLMAASEIADGKVYTESVKTNWRPPKHIRDMSASEVEDIREKWHILTEGENIPPPIRSFRDMRFPQVPMLPICWHRQSA